MLNTITGEKLVDGLYILGIRPTLEHDGNPLFIINITDGHFEFNVGKDVKEVFNKSIEFILKSGNWCTMSEMNNNSNFAKYLIVTTDEFMS